MPFRSEIARQRFRQAQLRAALETLAIVAYQQPVTRPYLESVRGVEPASLVPASRPAVDPDVPRLPLDGAAAEAAR